MRQFNPYNAPQASVSSKHSRLLQFGLVTFALISIVLNLVMVGVTSLVEGVYVHMKSQLVEPYKRTGLMAHLPDFLNALYVGLACNALLMLLVIWFAFKKEPKQ